MFCKKSLQTVMIMVQFATFSKVPSHVLAKLELKGLGNWSIGKAKTGRIY